MNNTTCLRAIRSLPLFFLLLLITGCESEDDGPGTCRVTMIRWERAGSTDEIRYEYNAQGLITSKNNWAGSECAEYFFYDAADRLARRTMECKGPPFLEVIYDYTVPDEIQIVRKDMTDNTTTSITSKYFNGDLAIDSVVSFSPDTPGRSTLTHITYLNGLITATSIMERPCCTEYATTGIQFDSGTNPHRMLQQATNTVGMESMIDLVLTQVYPNASSEHNPSAYTLTRRERLSEADPRIVSEEVHRHTFEIEYHRNSRYPSKIIQYIDGVKEATSVLYFYKDCF